MKTTRPEEGQPKMSESWICGNNHIGPLTQHGRCGVCGCDNVAPLQKLTVFDPGRTVPPPTPAKRKRLSKKQRDLEVLNAMMKGK